MTTYRRRPAQADAIQWTDTNADELATFAGQRFMTVDPEDRVDNPDATAALLESAHSSWADLEPGDWVVKRGDQFAVLMSEEFADLYEPTDGGALRDRIAAALYAHDHPGHLVPLNETGMESAYRESADAMLAVLPPPADRAAVLTEVADRLKQKADALTEGAHDVAMFVAKARIAEAEILDREAAELRRVAVEAQQQTDTERPRCPRCQMPHDLTPDSMGTRACESIRARITEAGRRHAGGDHGGCAAVDCETVRARRAEQPAVVAAVAGEAPDGDQPAVQECICTPDACPPHCPCHAAESAVSQPDEEQPC